MASEPFFDLRSPQDLLRKLEWEYTQWQDDPLNTYRAWNFFVTAEHLPDWIYHQDMLTSGKPRPDLLGLPHGEPRDFRLSRPLTRLCSRLASGGKHFYIKDSRIKKVVDRTGLELTGYVEDDWVEDDYVGETPALVVYLVPDEVAALQQVGVPVTVDAIEVLWVAARVLAFWRQFPVFQPRSVVDAP